MSHALRDKLKALKSLLKVRIRRYLVINRDFKINKCLDKLKTWEFKAEMMDLSPEDLVVS